MKRLLLLLPIAVLAVSGCGGSGDGLFGGDGTSAQVRELRQDVDQLRSVSNSLKNELDRSNPSINEVTRISNNLNNLTRELEDSSERVIRIALNCVSSNDQDIVIFRRDVDDLREVADDLRDEMAQNSPRLEAVRDMSNFLNSLSLDMKDSSEQVIRDAENCRR